MTELLDVEPGARVLEVGTGCGYQTAVLCALGATVYSIEVVEPLAAAAAERLKTLGYAQATVRAGDGYAGWPEEAPFDGIIVHRGGGVRSAGASGAAQARRLPGDPRRPRRPRPSTCSASRNAPTGPARLSRCCRWPSSP